MQGQMGEAALINLRSSKIKWLFTEKLITDLIIFLLNVVHSLWIYERVLYCFSCKTVFSLTIKKLAGNWIFLLQDMENSFSCNFAIKELPSDYLISRNLKNEEFFDLLFVKIQKIIKNLLFINFAKINFEYLLNILVC